MGCCDQQEQKPVANAEVASCCGSGNPRSSSVDWLLWLSSGYVLTGYLGYWLLPRGFLPDPVYHLSHVSFELINTMWWGILFGILFVGILDKVPREFVMRVLGTGHGFRSIFRATFAGVMLDLCNHGILMVAVKLYERGASIAQVVAFLLASPWNSLSLTLILWALVGWQWTLLFILASMIIGLATGYLFEQLERQGRIPANPNRETLDGDFLFWEEARKGLSTLTLDRVFFLTLLIEGLKESRMVLRWLFFGVVLASLVRVFVPVETFNTWLGPTVAGLFVTLLVTTLLEVCSEGSTPIAADILNRASAPGNSFAFLMAGAATDYTEIMSIKEVTSSWRIALLIPVLSVPQVLVAGYLFNQVA